MAFNVGKRKAAIKTAVIPFDGEEIKVQYRPSEWTPRVTVELQETEGAAQTRYSMDLLSRLIVDWDVEGADGKPFPVSRESLESLDQPVINAITDGILEDMRPKPKTAKR